MSFTSVGETYWTISSYEGCPKNLLITTMNECTLASRQLGLSFMNVEENYDKRPGCNTRDYVSHVETPNRPAYFNYATTDHSPTTLDTRILEICRSGSIGYFGVGFFKTATQIVSE